MAHFILVHGMFHGGWCWDRLQRRLEAMGHEVEAPDLAGCGADATPPGEVTLERWAGDVAALARASADKVIMVGHSRGGFVISQAAEDASEKVAALVYLTALMLPNGASPMMLPQIMEEEGFSGAPGGIAPGMGPDGKTLLAPPNAGDIFYGKCSAEDRAWAEPQVTPEPLMPMMATLSLTDERYGTLPKIYIETTEDQTLPISAQRAMIARGKPDEVITMVADHMPILTHVEELAKLLDRIAQRHATRIAA